MRRRERESERERESAGEFSLGSFKTLSLPSERRNLLKIFGTEIVFEVKGRKVSERVSQRERRRERRRERVTELKP